MRLRDKRTIIGIEPTTHGLAYVVFDHGELLYWGCSDRTPKYDDIATVDRLIGHYGAALLVLEDPEADGCRRGARVKTVLRNLEQYAAFRRLKTKSVAREATRERWRSLGRNTNEAVAAGIADMFPMLRPRVPPRRKAFMPEDERVRIFGAVTLVLAATKSLPSRLAS